MNLLLIKLIIAVVIIEKTCDISGIIKKNSVKKYKTIVPIDKLKASKKINK